MKKIIFPTDFSEVSRNAFIYALKLAEFMNAEIVTMHVYQLPQANYVNISEYLHEMYDVTELSNFENYKDEVLAIPEHCRYYPIKKNTVYYAIQTGGYGFFYKSSFFSQNISSTY